VNATARASRIRKLGMFGLDIGDNETPASAGDVQVD
jgi:hypothetical protein